MNPSSTLESLRRSICRCDPVDPLRDRAAEAADLASRGWRTVQDRADAWLHDGRAHLHEAAWQARQRPVTSLLMAAVATGVVVWAARCVLARRDGR